MEKSTNKSDAKNMKRDGKSTAARKPISKQNQTMLEELLLEELRDIYWAEQHLVKALPKMQEASTSEELAAAFEEHLTVTEEQIARLEEVFELLGQKATGKKCEAMAGLVEEAESIIKDTEEGSATRDVALIIAAQKVEHYEIAAYGSLATLAKTLGRDEVANLLAETLEEEKETDELLTEIAENNINMVAAMEDEGGEEESEE